MKAAHQIIAELATLNERVIGEEYYLQLHEIIKDAQAWVRLNKDFYASIEAQETENNKNK